MASRAKRSKKKGKPAPKCKALLLCERVIVENGTGNVSIISTFAGFRVRDFAKPIGPFSVFMQLIDGIGKYDITVEIHDLRQQAVIIKSQKIELEFADRPNRGNLIIPVPPLTLNHPGAYDLVVFADGAEIDRQQFIAEQADDGSSHE